MKNTQIDAAMRKAFRMGQVHQKLIAEPNEGAAQDIAEMLEQHIKDAMLDENGDMEMGSDEEAKRRKRYE